MTVGLSTARAAALCRGMYGNVSPKRGNRLYYKGKGGLKPGRHTKHGRYVLDPKRKKELVVPELEGFTLKPYVSRELPRPTKFKMRKPQFGQSV
mmetsp:Transcript_11420/g.13094  ORF Transcript_11420/g.13094 Transcript_11420/m.13094 type:complete len:94 (-) Transcript_11420:1150-1431(-)